ncbi:MAG: flagellin [Phenylobacterium zucineum]|nr:MAG: flagellin [Phenylobacterium zucineum]
MNSSINTNLGAMIALQNLNVTKQDLGDTQTRISTGMKVASAKDNGAIFAIAQNQRGTSRALGTVQESLARNQSTVDVAMAAGSVVQDLLLQMKEKALSAVDSSVDTTSRAILNTDFKALRDQITKAVNNASFNGVNILSGTTIAALANETGTSKLTVAGQTMSLGGNIVVLAFNESFNTAATASTTLTAINTSINNVSTSLAKLGTSSRILGQHKDFISKLQDAMDAGIGNLVDADLAKESAKLQALQTKQQLGIQALSIANQTPQSLLSLFK